MGGELLPPAAPELVRRLSTTWPGLRVLYMSGYSDPAGAGRQDIYAAMGFRAQYIFVVPEHALVVVVTGGTRTWPDEQKPVRFLYSHILPAVRR